MAVSLCSSFLLSIIIIKTANLVQQQIWWKYIDEEAYFDALNMEERGNYTIMIRRPNNYEMSKRDNSISEVCDFLETYTILFLAIIGSCIAVVLFYKNKLEPPMKELEEASKMIAGNNLAFHITYENKDELGKLCREFEKMRTQLEENNKRTWRILEDEKSLRAAIAHDIRSPLSILEGYQEMLLEFIEEDNALDKEEILEMLQASKKQIERMHNFIENMRNMTKLEERKLSFTNISLSSLKKQIEEEIELLSKTSKITSEICMETEERICCIDSYLVLEILENLLSNAFRYAKKKIRITISIFKDQLVLMVYDDGNGFLEEPELLMKAFYHNNPGDDLQHFGMGLYLCKIYCEMHGGKLLLGNKENFGAYAKAIIQIKKEEEDRY